MEFFNWLTRSNSIKKENPASDQESTDEKSSEKKKHYPKFVQIEEENMKCVSVIIVGAGSRGFVYGFYGVNFPKRMKVVGVVDPRSAARENMKKYHEVDEDKYFEDWREAVEREKFADAVIITTPDKLHRQREVRALLRSLNLCSSGVTPEDCREIVSTCKEKAVLLAVGHVLRYHPVSIQIKELIDSGVIGDIVHIQHMEPVGFWHFAHSYVRGNWRNEAESTFSLLAKSCHDIDLISYWMGKQRCMKVSCFGALSHFTKENKPSGASSRCLDCAVEGACPYSAQKIYLNQGHFGWPVSVVCSNGVYDIESLTEALRTGPYGRCVYECDNDVCTNQVVNMEFEGGRTAAFTMMAFTYALGGRSTSIYGTKGELHHRGRGPITVCKFLTNEEVTLPAKNNAFVPPYLGGHDGADYNLIEAFISAVAKGDPSRIVTGPEDTLRSHLLVFHAERSRRENRVVNIDSEEAELPKP
ncbi:putative oxidoreductase YteT [Lithobates pipiens]